ncbi:MAG: hypothetical protein Q8O13_01445 [Candidatus Omnitrophota bacterium]|nr:hypothetical protein [Candidatus Omnitrophota bacterium]
MNLMKIKINHLDFAYDILRSLYLLHEGDSNARDRAISQSARGFEDDGVEKLKKRVAFTYPKIEMPEPFNWLGFILRRVGAGFGSSVIVAARDESVFSYSSGKIIEALKKDPDLKESYPGFEFAASFKHGAGYMMDKTSREIVYAIMEAGSIRDIGIGCNGACQISFNDDNSKEAKDNFKIDIGRLEKYASSMISLWYRPYIAKHGDIAEVPKDLVLHLNLV